jgi:hypothetical protein
VDVVVGHYDAILYRYLASNKYLSIRCKPPPEWVLNHCFVLQLFCRVALCILSLAPFVMEVNTDSSLTMFMQNFSSTLAFQVYVGFLAARFVLVMGQFFYGSIANTGHYLN